MKPFCLILLFACRLAFAQTNFYPLLNCSNRTYTNATISSFTPATATIMWDGGGERIDITNLPPDALIACGYDPLEKECYLAQVALKKSARQVVIPQSQPTDSKATAKMGKPQMVRVTKSVSGGAEVRVIIAGKYSDIYLHNVPISVLSFIDDYNNTLADFESTRYADASETVVISGPFRRSGQLTATAESVLRTRRHMTDLEASVIARTSVIARPTPYVNASGFRQWEFIATPSAQEALLADEQRTHYHLPHIENSPDEK